MDGRCSWTRPFTMGSTREVGSSRPVIVLKTAGLALTERVRSWSWHRCGTKKPGPTRGDRSKYPPDRDQRVLRVPSIPGGCVTNAKEESCRRPFGSGAVQEMEDCWPSGVGSREQASNHPVLRWLKTVVVSDRGKAGSIPSGGDREDVPEASAPRFGVGVTVEASSISS